MKLRTWMKWCWMSAAAFGLLWGQDQPDPPSRVARLNYLNGSVSFRPGSVDEWTAATLNYPLTTGDHLWTDQDSRVDMHVGSTVIHIADQTAFAILNLDDRSAQVSVSQGAVNIHLVRLNNDETFEVDTPNGAITLLRAGDYRIDVNGDLNSTAVVVRAGEAEVTGGGQAFPVHSRQMGRFAGTDQVAIETLQAPGPDEWDRWCANRDQHEDRAIQASSNYVPPEMIGAADLGDYGTWRNDPGYGAVWVPTRVEAGWEPYRYGHWAYVRPWGWTWIDDAPWGFAPFHYGRWALIGGTWVWVPGAVVARPVYAPALVVFVGGGGFDPYFRGGGGVAWIPLGPREIYRPSYRVSDTYVRNVNVTHVTNITRVNVTNVTYVNRTHVTAVSQTTFAGARPVAASVVRVSPDAMNRAQVVNTMDVRPVRESYMGRPLQPGARVGMPPARVAAREVIVRQAPPAGVRPMAPVRVARPNPNESDAVRNGAQPRVYGGRQPAANPPPPANTVPPVYPTRPANNDRPAMIERRQPATNQPPAGNPAPDLNRPNVERRRTEDSRMPGNPAPPANAAPPANNPPPPTYNRPAPNNERPIERRRTEENRVPRDNPPPAYNRPQQPNNPPAAQRPQPANPPQEHRPQQQGEQRRIPREPRKDETKKQ